MIRRTAKWTRQPAVPVELDETHSRAQGLVGLWMPTTARTGGLEQNLVTGADALVSSAGIRQLTPRGLGLASPDSSTVGWAYTFPARLQLQPPCTLILTGWVMDSRGSNDNGRVLSIDYDAANGNPYISAGFFRASDDIYASWNNGSYQSVNAPGIASGYPRQLSLALVLTPGNASYYGNGALITTSANVGTISYSATSRIAIGCTSGGAARGGVSVLSAGWYNRALTALEIKEWANDPYAILKPSLLPTRMYAAEVVGGAPATRNRVIFVL